MAEALTYLDFFHAVYPDVTHGTINFRLFGQKGTKARARQWFLERDFLFQLPLLMKNVTDQVDMYFAVSTRLMDQGDAGGIVEVPGIWGDYDAKTETKEEIMARLTWEDPTWAHGVPRLPSIIVDSGHGLHAYWLFRHPYRVGSSDFKQDPDRLWAMQLGMRYWAARSGGDMASTDLAHILRVPGTVNRKETPPLPVSIVYWHPERRYDAEVFLPKTKRDQQEYQRTARSLMETDEFQAQGQALNHVVSYQQRKSSYSGAPLVLSADEKATGLRLMQHHCQFMIHANDDASTLGENEWYAMISNLAAWDTDESRSEAHRMSSPHPGYFPRDTDRKYEHSLEVLQEKEMGPHTCQWIATHGWVCPLLSTCPAKSPAGLGIILERKAKEASTHGE